MNSPTEDPPRNVRNVLNALQAFGLLDYLTKHGFVVVAATGLQHGDQLEAATWDGAVDDAGEPMPLWRRVGSA
jgi:hypothetical protein